jgi:hypothetical protein
MECPACEAKGVAENRTSWAELPALGGGPGITLNGSNYHLHDCIYLAPNQPGSPYLVGQITAIVIPSKPGGILERQTRFPTLTVSILETIPGRDQVGQLGLSFFNTDFITLCSITLDIQEGHASALLQRFWGSAMSGMRVIGRIVMVGRKAATTSMWVMMLPLVSALSVLLVK